MSLIKLKKARVTHNSVVLNKLRPIKDSIINEHSAAYNRPNFLLKYIFPTLHFSKKNHHYILITNEWTTNYFHWIYDALTRLVLLQKLYPKFILVLPKDYFKIDYVVKSLEAFKVKTRDIVVVRKKSHIKVNNLSFISYQEFIPELEEFKAVRNILLKKFSDDSKVDFGDRVYISRNNPKKDFVRKVENEKQVAELLKKYDFKIIYMEEYNFAEQISIAVKIKYMIAPHGSGIANSFFMNLEGCILELVDQDSDVTCYQKTSQTMGIKHLRQNCKLKDQNKTPQISNIVIDIKQLEENIKSMLNI